MRAGIIETTEARVALDDILDTGRFSFESAHRHPTWFKELNGFKDHVPETQEYGITSFVYRARTPFEPRKLHAFFNQTWPNVVRAKGFFWLATRPQWVGELSMAGALVRHSAAGYWWAAVPKNRWPEDDELVARIKSRWHKHWGDRKQELVFIGTKDMDKVAITAALDACLMDLREEGKVDTRLWAKLPDPIAEWRQGA